MFGKFRVEKEMAHGAHVVRVFLQVLSLSLQLGSVKGVGEGLWRGCYLGLEQELPNPKTSHAPGSSPHRW